MTVKKIQGLSSKMLKPRVITCPQGREQNHENPESCFGNNLTDKRGIKGSESKQVIFSIENGKIPVYIFLRKGGNSSCISLRDRPIIKHQCTKPILSSRHRRSGV
jgi:hypothetical protein